MKHVLSLTLCSLAGLLLTSCSTISVSHDYDTAADFTRFQFFEWLPSTPTKSGNPRLDGNDIMHRNIRNAVEAQLIAAGYRKASSGTGDFLLGYHVLVDQKVSAQVINSYYPTRYGYGSTWGVGYHPRYWTSPAMAQPQVVVTNYEEGTLILDVVDAYSKRMIWRGTASARVSKRDSATKNRNRINSAVEKLLATFPPK